MIIDVYIHYIYIYYIIDIYILYTHTYILCIIHIYISPRFTGIAAPPSNHGCKNPWFVVFFQQHDDPIECALGDGLPTDHRPIMTYQWPQDHQQDTGFKYWIYEFYRPH